MNYKFFLLRKGKNSDNRDNKERLIACRTIRLGLLVDEHDFFSWVRFRKKVGSRLSSQVMNKKKKIAKKCFTKEARS